MSVGYNVLTIWNGALSMPNLKILDIWIISIYSHLLLSATNNANIIRTNTNPRCDKEDDKKKTIYPQEWISFHVNVIIEKKLHKIDIRPWFRDLYM